ncbi:hypothetical protein RUM44_001610 [Polyplax serrata]|uniref:GLTSCR protein conserved domain-containing protein n=1 Tax=Polyplax serrata TaxID=468196 RepID=A0ABR1AKI8_POLSC
MNLYATCCESAASSLAVAQYPPIAPNRNQVVNLLPQPGHLLGRTQIMPGGTQNQIPKAKQPQQILPKPIPPKTSPQKQSVPRLNTAMPQQTPLLINQPQTQSPALLLNQVLTSGAPVIVQPAGPGGTVHLMLRTPTPALQSGPGPPQNKMIIANATQPQPQATVLIQNRQQVVRFMTAQGPMQLQQIQTPSGPQLIAIPQNQSLSFPTNSVLVQGPTANTLQLQQNSGNTLQLRQSPSIIQSNSFPQTSLSGQIPLQNQLFQGNATTTATVSLKRDEKSNVDNAICVTGSTEQKKMVIDNKISISVPTTAAQKNITASLRQVRTGALANRNKQSQDAKDKPEESNSKSMSNLTRIIDSVASNTEHMISPPPKMDNLTATINSVAENIKSPTPDDIMSKLSLTDVFMTGNKSLNLNKRPNLTIVQKQTKGIPGEVEDSNMAINRLIMSPNANSAVDFDSISSENYDSLELREISSATGAQTLEPQGFVVEQNTSSNQGVFQAQEDGKAKAKKKPCAKKKGKKEENKVDLWDLMKSAGIGDDEFDEPSDIGTFQPTGGSATASANVSAITEPLEMSDTDLLTQFQTPSQQVQGGIRVVVGEDGRPVIINGGNVLIPENVQNNSTATTTEASDADAVLQNMILPDSVFNFTPQAFATAQTQLNQLIQDHGGLTTSSADQQLLSQIFGATPSSIANNSAPVTTSTAPTPVQSTPSTVVPNVQTQTVPPPPPAPCNESVLVNVATSNNTVPQTAVVQKPEPKSEFISEPPPGLPPLGPDSLVITNNNGVPTLVASPALMQYLQTHQGIIQFQHDPVTKTIQPSLIIPHPQHKTEPLPAPKQDNLTPAVPNNVRAPNQNQDKKSRTELKTSVGTTTDDQKANMNSVLIAANSNFLNPKLNMVKLVKENPSLLHIATETNNLINFKERNKTLSEKELSDIDKKIQQNRTILDQFLIVDNSRSGVQVGTGPVQNIIVKDNTSKDGVAYQVGPADKLFAIADNKTTETQTLEDLQNLDVTLIKGFHTGPTATSNTNSVATPSSDFQAKFLESIGMANKTPPKATVSIGTGTSSISAQPITPIPVQSPASAKRGRKKKDKIQNQATQADVKTDMPCLTFNIAELTPEQNVKLNQALQSRGAIVSQIENLDAIKQIIHEEVRKITSKSMDSANIRFTSSSHLSDKDVGTDQGPATTATANVVLNNPNLNQLLEHPTSQGNVISLQGNELIAINSGNQQIFSPQNQVLSGNHFVSSNNQILAIGGSHNQLVSLGNPINSSNQIVTLGNPPNLMSVAGGNVASPGAVIVGGNGNVVAIVHQNAPSGQNSGIVQRIQTIQLTTPKQQHFKTIQSQIQTLSSKTNRTAAEQATLQKLIIEQQKILSTGKLVQTFPGQQVHGMQIVSQSLPNAGRIFQAQGTAQQQQQGQLSQVQQGTQSLQQSQPHTFITANSNSQLAKSNFTTQTVVSCGTNTSDLNSSFQSNIPKMSVPPTVLISDVPTSNYGPLYVSPNTSGKNVTKCEKGTSPIQIQMGTQTVTNLEFRSGKMSTGTMTSPNTGKPQAVVAPAIVIQQTETQSPTYQIKPRNQTTVTEPIRAQVPALSRTAFIEQQMRTDQAGATMPDTKTPFLSKSDACKRLIRYHVMDEKALSPQDLATADDIFEATAQHLLDKFRVMKEKYKYLLMLESMREVSTAERIMVDRNFIIEERMELEELREKEKRLQEEFENPTIIFRGNTDTIVKTELTLDDVQTEMNNLIGQEEVKFKPEDDDKETMISKSKIISDINSDSLKDNCFKLTEANRDEDLVKIKSETKECKNTRTSFDSVVPFGGEDEDQKYDISTSKCKAKSARTFSDGSSKSSMDSSKDEDSGADINAQVQSAIDSILNLQKCDTLSEVTDETGGTSGKRAKKKRKLKDKLPSDNSKKLKIKGFIENKDKSGSDESEDETDRYRADCDDDEDGGSSDADPILDEAIRSILTS